MKTFHRNITSARLVAILAVSSVPAAIAPAYAGLPVIDSANLSQNVVTALENVSHTAKQIQQYQTQLRQYENMLINTTAPAREIWDAARTTMRDLRSSIDTLNYYKANLGSIDTYLGKFKDTATYRSSPCYSVNGCSAADWLALKDSDRLGSESQKKATDALFKGLDRQQEAMQSDATQLEALQSAARGSSGQLEAIGYANQLASNQANQLLQIRGLLIAQQNAIATRNQALADREAKEAAAGEQLRGGTYTPSPVRAW